MPEYIHGTPEEKQKISAELEKRRSNVQPYLNAEHPGTSFVTLADLLESSKYEALINQRLLLEGIQKSKKRLETYGAEGILPLSRVCVGIGSSRNEPSRYQPGFGGFHQPKQGYRHIQMISVVSILGAYSSKTFSPTLASLDLLRGYTHDCIHYNSLRRYSAVPGDALERTESSHEFYRFQYGINFRKADSSSYSLRDPRSTRSTRNLGVVMEAAADSFAQSVVLEIAEQNEEHASSSLLEAMIYRDCIGRIHLDDIGKLMQLKRDDPANDLPEGTPNYIENLLDFYEQVTVRYRDFLHGFELPIREILHEEVVKSSLTGKMRRLVSIYNSHSQMDFMSTFKNNPEY